MKAVNEEQTLLRVIEVRCGIHLGSPSISEGIISVRCHEPGGAAVWQTKSPSGAG